MRVLNILFAILLSAGIASAQTPERLIEEIRSDAEDACVTVTYSLDASIDGARIQDEGVVVAQDDIWCLKGQTLEIYTCKDGTWIMHPEAKEAMVEPKWNYEDLVAFCRTIISSSGNDLGLNIRTRTVSEKKPVSYFVPETGHDWVVTDLR